MNSRERVSKAIHFGKPDRPPIQHAILPCAQYQYGEALKKIIDAVHEDFGWHLLPDLPIGKLPPLYKKGTNMDDFGTVWLVEENGRCGIPKEYPIAEDWSNYKDYTLPEVFNVGPPKRSESKRGAVTRAPPRAPTRTLRRSEPAGRSYFFLLNQMSFTPMAPSLPTTKPKTPATLATFWVFTFFPPA